ncbi:hypothetical protein VUR80DRAFT_6255 [Thermomyces stellatus]
MQGMVLLTEPGVSLFFPLPVCSQGGRHQRGVRPSRPLSLGNEPQRAIFFRSRQFRKCPTGLGRGVDSTAMRPRAPRGPPGGLLSVSHSHRSVDRWCCAHPVLTRLEHCPLQTSTVGRSSGAPQHFTHVTRNLFGARAVRCLAARNTKDRHVKLSKSSLDPRGGDGRGAAQPGSPKKKF